MTPTLIVLILATCFLAYSNGANDNFKGVATLFGSGTAGYRGALSLATVSTFAGSAASIFLARSLIKTFSGSGLVPATLAGTPEFLLAVALGAGLTVMLATATGFPVSTTHGLTGALVGAGFMAIGTRVNFEVLGGKFFLPLLVSPLLALLLSAAAYAALRGAGARLGIGKERMRSAMDGAHYASAGMVGFARGLNDTPKIVALLLGVQALGVRGGMAAVGVAMALGGVLNARKVADTMSKKITPLDHEQGLTANAVTAFLVIFASRLGVPVSTTHVSVGSLFGIGGATGKANPRVVSEILLSWVLTLPVAAALSAGAYWVVRA